MGQLSNTLLVGYYGKKNLGDDALLLATAWANKHILKNESLSCTASDSIDLYDFQQSKPTLSSKQMFPGQNRLLQYKLAWQSKQIVMGGGSVLHSSHDVNIKRVMLKLSKKFNSNIDLLKQHMAVGVGIEDFKDEKAKLACQQFLNECPFVGLRDQQSFNRAKELAPSANIAQTFDLAPALLCHPALVAHKKQMKAQGVDKPSRYGIAINLCSVPIDPFGNVSPLAESKRILQYANLICKMLTSTAENITLLSFNAEPMGDTNRLNDDQLLAKVKMCVAKLISDPKLLNRVHLMNYDPDPINTIKILSSFKLVIAMRLHASILSYISETPVLSVNYHSKCSAWCQQIGMPVDYQIPVNDADLDKLHGTILAGLTTGFSKPKLPIKTALSQSLKNWRLTDEQISYFCDHSAL